MRLRPGRSEHDLKRRSTLDPAGLFRRSDRPDRGDESDKSHRPTESDKSHRPTEHLAPQRGAVSEDGRRPPSSEPARPSVSPDSHHPPPSSPRPTNPRRFSMLRFRHASDSQLSTTAKEHAARDAPPVPPVPPNPAQRSSERSNERTSTLPGMCCVYH